MPSTIVIKYVVDTSELQKARESSVRAQKATDDLRNSTKALGNDVKTMSANASRGFGDLKQLVATISFAGLVAGLTAVTKKIFELGVANQQLRITFETLLGSAEQAKKTMAELTKFSILTPFTPDQVNRAAKALLSFDVEAKKIIPTLKFLGDISSATGKDLAEMAVIFGQIRSNGRLTGQDLLQLINAGFNPLQQISKDTGKSMRELRAEMEKGLVTFDMVEKAFVNATSEGGRFFNLMEKQSATIGGNLSTIEGNIEEISKKLFEANESGLADFIKGIAKLTSNVDGSAKAIGKWLDLVTIVPRKTLDVFTFFVDKISAARSETERLRKEQLELQLAIAKGDLDNASGEQRIKLIRQIIDLSGQLGQLNFGTTEDPLPWGDPKKVDKAVDTVKKAADKRKETANEVAEYLAYLSDQELFNTKELLKEKQQQRENDAEHEKELLREQEALSKEAAENTRKHWKESYEKRGEAAKEAAERQRDIDRDLEQSAYAVARAIAEFAFNTRNEELEQIRSFYGEQIELAGDNERRRKELEIERERAEAEAREREKQAEKTAAIAKILIETAINIAQAYPNPILMAAAAAIGSIQVANVQKLKDGAINLKGPGTETSDSIPAMLSKGESVMTAKQTRESFGILTDIREGRLNDKIIREISLKGGSTIQTLNDERIVGELKAIRKGQYKLEEQYGMLYKIYQDDQGNKKKIRSNAMGK